MITKGCLILILVVALLPCLAIAKDAAFLNQQLRDAAKSGDLPLVKSLLDKGANVNARDRRGGMALSEAARTRPRQCCEAALGQWC